METIAAAIANKPAPMLMYRSSWARLNPQKATEVPAAPSAIFATESVADAISDPVSASLFAT